MLYGWVNRAADSLVAVALLSTALAAIESNNPLAQSHLSVMQDVRYRATDSLVAVTLLPTALPVMPNNDPSAQSTSYCDAGLDVQGC